jgi:hypothetical protein
MEEMNRRNNVPTDWKDGTLALLVQLCQMIREGILPLDAMPLLETALDQLAEEEQIQVEKVRAECLQNKVPEQETKAQLLSVRSWAASQWAKRLNARVGETERYRLKWLLARWLLREDKTRICAHMFFKV